MVIYNGYDYSTNNAVYFANLDEIRESWDMNYSTNNAVYFANLDEIRESWDMNYSTNIMQYTLQT